MKNNFYKKYLIGLIIISFVFSNAFFAFPKKAGAQFGVFLDPSNLVQNTISAVANPVTAAATPISAGANVANTAISSSMWAKEYLLDPIAWAIVNQIIHQISKSTVNWINTGFKGSPTFVTNPGDLLKDAADQASGIFFEELGLTKLCQPFRVRLELALRTKSPFEERMRCTLSRVISNIENFEKNFAAGGWAGWIAITTQPQNNIYDAYLESSSELAKRQEEQQSLVKLETSWGSGFLSTKKCVEYSNEELYDFCLENSEKPEMCEKSFCTRYETETPGKVIGDRLNTALGADFGRLEVSDEIDEIIGALLNQFISSAVRSLRSGGGGGGGVETTEAPLTENLKNGAMEIIDLSIANEQRYMKNKQNSLDIIAEATSTLNSLKNCYQNKFLVYQTKINEIETKITNYGEKSMSLQSDIGTSTALIAEAKTYKTEISSATTYEELSKILDDFNNVMKPKMHSIDEIVNAVTEYATLQRELGQINVEYSECTSPTS